MVSRHSYSESIRHFPILQRQLKKFQSQQTFTYSKSTKETLEKGVKYIQSY